MPNTVAQGRSKRAAPKLFKAAIYLIGFALFAGLIAPPHLLAVPINSVKAKSAVQTFLTTRFPAVDLTSIRTVTVAGSSWLAIAEVVPLLDNNITVGYIATLEPSGYVLVRADDEVSPVKIYTENGNFDRVPPGFLKVIKLELAEELQSLTFLKQSKAPIDRKFQDQWSALLNPADLQMRTTLPTSSPGINLLTTEWDQNEPYNYYSPTASGGPDGRAYAGCNATALAQILRYHGAPSQVTQDHTYTDNSGFCTGSHSISDAGIGPYAWANMPTSISTSSPLSEQQAIGQLIYHAGVALESNFEYDATGASPPVVPSVLSTYFSYTSGSYESKLNFTSSQWYSKISTDIDAGRPVFYAMWEAGDTNGHSVVCDGYRNGNEIHLNLGWSGSGNTWYNIDTVSGGYTWTNHKAVFGITPPRKAWTRKRDFGGAPRYGAVGFSIGSKGYLGTGDPGGRTGSKDFWEYDPAADTWTQKADFGGAAGWVAIGFSIGSKGYLGGGGMSPDGPIGFWEYNPATNTWTQKADPGTSRHAAVGFSIGSKGYVGTGVNAITDFEEYDPATNIWRRKADFGGAPRYGAVGFSIGSKGYIGTGKGELTGYLNDFWEYDPATDTWTRKADFGGIPRFQAVGFSIGSKGYIGTGTGELTGYLNDFWEYDPATDTWTQKDDFGGAPRGLAVGFSIGSKGYLGTGLVTPNSSVNDFWEYGEAMSVTPGTGLTSSGTVGGPFSPASTSYTLTNTGGTSINWSATKVHSWVTLSSASGILASGTSTTVTVSINSGANSLGAGGYSDTVTFTNTTNGTGNTTRSVGLTVNAVPDTTPPTPDPMPFVSPPVATSSTAIAMTATTATDATPPVSYFFDFVDSTTGGTGGTDSAWQAGTSYTDSGLQPNHRYGYRVKARDNAATPAETAYSATVYKYTLANTPVLAAYSGVTQTAIQANWTANGNRTGTEYYVENTTRGTNSGWVTALLWKETGLTAGTSYTYRVKARNGDGIETVWIGLGSQSTFGLINQIKNNTFISGLTDWMAHFNQGCGETRTADVIWDALKNSSVLRLKSILAGSCGGSSGILQNLNLNLMQQGNILGANPKSAFLQLDVEIISTTTPNVCGFQGQEAPGQIALTYLPTNGTPKQLIFSFYYAEAGMTCEQPTPLANVTFVPVQVQQGLWTTFTSEDLKSYVTDMDTITAIDVLAAGWDYETYFDNIQLSVQQDSNGRLFLPLIIN